MIDPLLFLVAALAGPVPSTVPVPVLARAVERGEILSPADFEPQPRAPGAAIGVLPVEGASGRELIRNMPAGAVIRAGDVTSPRLVRRGEPVTINLRADGLVIATAGRAMTSGGRGDLVRVVATATNRTFDTVVEKAGAVRLSLP